MTKSTLTTSSHAADAPSPGRLRVTRNGYDPAEVHQLLHGARRRMSALIDRLHRLEKANRAMRGELRRMQAEVDEADAARQTFEKALVLVESTATAARADARREAEHILDRARREAHHIVNLARIEARRAQTDERRALRQRASELADEEERLHQRAAALEAEEARIQRLQATWRRKACTVAADLLTAAGSPEWSGPALPAAGATSTGRVIDLRDERSAGSRTSEEAPERWMAEDGQAAEVFERFMSPAIADDPSRQWVLGPP